MNSTGGQNFESCTCRRKKEAGSEGWAKKSIEMEMLAGASDLFGKVDWGLCCRRS